MAGESKRVMKNITRVKDYKKRVDGYYVRIGWKGKNYSKLFPIKRWGSEEIALHHAVEWRDRKEAEIGKPRTDRFVMGITRPTNTGVKGITRMKIRHWKNGKKVGKIHDWLVVTTFDEAGNLNRTGFSIDKHGEEKAMLMAKKAYEERSFEPAKPRDTDEEP